MRHGIVSIVGVAYDHMLYDKILKRENKHLLGATPLSLTTA